MLQRARVFQLIFQSLNGAGNEMLQGKQAILIKNRG